MLRSSLLEVLRQDFIRTARAKGLRESGVLYGHALKNSFIPVLTVIGIQIGYLLGGAVIIETVFAWRGVGFLAVQAMQKLDFPLVMADVFAIACSFVVVNLLVDLLYGVLDPRIRLA
jgi:peptide/nickel transport system permease protein